MAAIYQKARKKAGTIAIPFLITILISLIVLGGVAYYFYGKLTDKTRELQPLKSATTSISSDDVNEILFVLKPDDTEHSQPAVMLFRFDPVRKQEFCVGIPLTLMLDHDGKDETVLQCLENHGVTSLRTDLSKLLDQPIARYISMNSTGFQKLVSLIGNVSYVVTIKDRDLRPSEVSEELEPSQLEMLLTSLKYNTEVERNSVIGFAVASMLNQCSGQRIASNLDGYFKAVINQVTTDVTAQDFSTHRHAISYVFENASSPARGVTLSMEQDGDCLRLAKGTVEALKVTFSQKSAG